MSWLDPSRMGAIEYNTDFNDKNMSKDIKFENKYYASKREILDDIIVSSLKGSFKKEMLHTDSTLKAKDLISRMKSSEKKLTINGSDISLEFIKQSENGEIDLDAPILVSLVKVKHILYAINVMDDELFELMREDSVLVRKFNLKEKSDSTSESKINAQISSTTTTKTLKFEISNNPEFTTSVTDTLTLEGVELINKKYESSRYSAMKDLDIISLQELVIEINKELPPVISFKLGFKSLLSSLINYITENSNDTDK